MRVAIQGTHGSFSEAAARRRWPDLEALPCREVKDVVAAVREGEAEAGCLPIENSLIGSVTTTYDLLARSLRRRDAAADARDPVSRSTTPSWRCPGARLDGIRRVLSHPVALGQCRIWLSEHLPDAELVSAWDTAGSAEIVAQEGNPALAAIAARPAADAHGLVAAGRAHRGRSHQPDPLPHLHPRGRRRAGRRRRGEPLQDLAHRADRPQARHARADAAGVRRRAGVNLMALQSRPERSAPWTYRFYVDIDGSTTDPRVAEALEEVEALAARARGAGQLRGLGRGLAALGAAADPGAPQQEARHPAGGPPTRPGWDAGEGRAADVRRRRARCSSPDPARSRARR